MNAATAILSRQFSRQGINFMKVAQDTETAAIKNTDSGLVFKAAVLLSLMGMGFSVFSISQLQDSKARGIGRICAPKSWEKIPATIECLKCDMLCKLSEMNVYCGDICFNANLRLVQCGEFMNSRCCRAIHYIVEWQHILFCQLHIGKYATATVDTWHYLEGDNIFIVT